VHAARLAAERITAARPKAVLRRVELVGLAL
jgi:hypothetical protein